MSVDFDLFVSNSKVLSTKESATSTVLLLSFKRRREHGWMIFSLNFLTQPINAVSFTKNVRPDDVQRGKMLKNIPLNEELDTLMIAARSTHPFIFMNKVPYNVFCWILLGISRMITQLLILSDMSCMTNASQERHP